MMVFNPKYVPTGRANKLNPYFKKINNVRIPKTGRNKLEFLGEGSPIVIDGGALSTFTRDGVDYTQVIFETDGSITFLRDVDDVSIAVAAGGGSGGTRNGQAGFAGGGGGAGGLIQSTNQTFPKGDYAIKIGKGGIGSGTTGVSGGDTTVTGPRAFTAKGGGGGGGGATTESASGVNGGCGGGGGGYTSSPFAGGTGSQGGKGGTGINASTSAGRSAGAGGGAAGNGADGVAGQTGAPGLGVIIEFMEPPTQVCTGGFGSTGTTSMPVSPARWGDASSGKTGLTGFTLDAKDGVVVFVIKGSATFATN